MRFTTSGIALALVPVLLACGDLGELVSLQQGLSQEFRGEAINVNINNGVRLTVTFMNSRAAELPDSERAVFARRVAEYVRDHYARYDSLETVNIGFGTVKGGGPVRFTRTTVPYRFTRQELGPPRPVSKRATT